MAGSTIIIILIIVIFIFLFSYFVIYPNTKYYYLKHKNHEEFKKYVLSYWIPQELIKYDTSMNSLQYKIERLNVSEGNTLNKFNANMNQIKGIVNFARGEGSVENTTFNEIERECNNLINIGYSIRNYIKDLKSVGFTNYNSDNLIDGNNEYLRNIKACTNDGEIKGDGVFARGLTAFTNIYKSTNRNMNEMYNYCSEAYKLIKNNYEKVKSEINDEEINNIQEVKEVQPQSQPVQDVKDVEENKEVKEVENVQPQSQPIQEVKDDEEVKKVKDDKEVKEIQPQSQLIQNEKNEETQKQAELQETQLQEQEKIIN